MATPTLSTASTFSPVRAIVIALVVLAVVGVAVFTLNPTKTAVLTVPHIDLFTPHTEFKSMAGPTGTHIIDQPNASEDDLYVVATIHMQDKLRLPIFINYAEATLTSADGTQVTANIISPGDLPNLKITFPAIAPLLPSPLATNTEIAPGATAEGQILLLFPGATRKTWETKKSANLTINLTHQDPITVPLT